MLVPDEAGNFKCQTFGDLGNKGLLHPQGTARAQQAQAAAARVDLEAPSGPSTRHMHILAHAP